MEDEHMAKLLRRDLLGLVASTVYGASLAGPVARLFDSVPAASVKVGAHDVGRLREARMRITLGGNLLGGGTFRVKELLRDYRRAAGLLQGDFASESLRQQAHAAAATVTRQIGFEFYDLGLQERAQQLWLASLAMARDAHPSLVPVLQAHVMENMFHQAITQGQPGRAFELLCMLGGRERLLPSRQRAMLAIMKAHAVAGLGDVNETRRLIGYAEDHLNEPTDERDLEWDFEHWWSHAELDGIAARALLTLAPQDRSLAQEALNRATAAIQTQPPEQARTKARLYTSLVQFHATLGDVDATEAAARTAIDTARHLRSPRITGELLAIRPLLRRWHTRPAIREIDQDIKTLITV
jgi:hypothetical protein